MNFALNTLDANEEKWRENLFQRIYGGLSFYR